MTRQDHGFIGQRPKFGANASQQHLVVSIGEIGSSDSATEQNIAPDQGFRLREEKAYAVRGMPLDVKQLAGKPW